MDWNGRNESSLFKGDIIMTFKGDIIRTYEYIIKIIIILIL